MSTEKTCHIFVLLDALSDLEPRSAT